MQLVRERNEILCVYGRAFLFSRFPAGMEILIQTCKPVLIFVQAKCLEGGGILLPVVTADTNNPVMFFFWFCLMPVGEHVIDNLIHTYALSQPHPAVLFFVGLAHDLSGINQVLSQPIRRNIPIICVYMNAVITLLHLAAPLIDGCIRILWRVIQVYHLETTLIPADKGRLNVCQLILTFSVIKKLGQLVQDDQLDGLILINDSLCIVNTIGASKVHRGTILFIGYLHRGLPNLECALFDTQAIDTPQHLFIHRLTQFVVMLTQNNHGAVLITD